MTAPGDFMAAALSALGPWLVVTAVAGLPVLGAGLLLARAQRSPEGRIAIWRASCAAVLALPVLMALVAFGVVPTPPVAGWGGRVPRMGSARPDPSAVSTARASIGTPGQAESLLPSTKKASREAATSPEPGRAASRPTADRAGDGRIGDALGVVFLVWLAGSVVMLARVFLGLYTLRRHGRSARPVEADLEAWARAHLPGGRWPVSLQILRGGPWAVPVCWGVRRVTILLPPASRDWTTERVYAVLQHELVHAARRDALHLIVARVAAGLHWFNPLTWIVAERLERDAERFCDELVLRLGVPCASYASALVETARDARRHGRPRGLPASTVRTSALEERIERILAVRSAPSPASTGIVGAAGVLLVAVGTVLAAASPAPAPVQAAVRGAPQAVRAANRRADPGDPIVDALIEALGDPAADVRRSVINSLRDIGAQPGLDAIRGLLNDPDEDVRRAAEVVVGLRPPERNLTLPAPRPSASPAQATLDSLARQLAAAEFHVRQSAAWALGNLADPRSLPALVGALEDPDFHVREAATAALGHIGDARALAGLTARLADEDFHVRQAAASALGHIGAAGAVPALVRAWPDPVDHVRARIVSALGTLGDPAGLAVALEGVRDPSTDVRRASASALGRLAIPIDGPCPDPAGQVSTSEAAGAVDRLLRDPDAGRRRRAALVLGRPDLRREADSAGGKGTHHALVAALGDPDGEVRVAAACSLAEVGDPRALDALTLRTRDDESEPLRAAARWAIERIRARAGDGP